MRRLKIVNSVVAIVAMGLIAGCYESPTGPGQPALTTVRLTLAADSIEVGQTTTATVTALDQYGLPIAAGPAKFTSSSPDVATVNESTGAIEAISPGTAQITVTIAGKTAQRTITVL